jgi:hypothetical protein
METDNINEATRNGACVERLVSTILVRRPRLGFSAELWAWAQGEPVALPLAA